MKLKQDLMAALAVLLLSATVNAGPVSTDAMQSARRTAEKAMQIYGKGFDQKRKLYELGSDDDVTKLQLGEPIPLHLLDPVKAAAWKEGGKLADLVSFSGTFIFPVDLEGKPRCILFINQAGEGDWQIGAFGMAPLARLLHGLRGRVGGREALLVTVPDSPVFFFNLPGRNFENLTPLTSLTPSGRDGKVDVVWPDLVPLGTAITSVLAPTALSR